MDISSGAINQGRLGHSLYTQFFFDGRNHSFDNGGRVDGFEVFLISPQNIEVRQNRWKMEFKFKQGKYASTRVILSPAKFDYLAFFEHFVFLPTKMGTLVEQKNKSQHLERCCRWSQRWIREVVSLWYVTDDMYISYIYTHILYICIQYMIYLHILCVYIYDVTFLFRQ